MRSKNLNKDGNNKENGCERLYMSELRIEWDFIDKMSANAG